MCLLDTLFTTLTSGLSTRRRLASIHAGDSLHFHAATHRTFTPAGVFKHKIAADIKDTASQSAFRDVDEIARDNQRNSSLLRLPGEFRNRVYEYTFYGTEVVVKSPYVDYLTLPQIGFPFSVLAICKQINHETSCIFWIMCIIDAELLFCSTLLEETMEGSTSARITSLVVDEDVARGPYSSSIQQTFPKLRKLYVQNFLFNGDTADVVTSLSAQGIEVECRDAERYTELEESERPAYLEDSEEEF